MLLCASLLSLLEIMFRGIFISLTIPFCANHIVISNRAVASVPEQMLKQK